MEIDRDTLTDLYRTMVTIRAFEERGIPETQKRDVGGALHRVGRGIVQGIPATLWPDGRGLG